MLLKYITVFISITLALESYFLSCNMKPILSRQSYGMVLSQDTLKLSNQSYVHDIQVSSSDTTLKSLYLFPVQPLPFVRQDTCLLISANVIGCNDPFTNKT